MAAGAPVFAVLARAAADVVGAALWFDAVKNSAPPSNPVASRQYGSRYVDMLRFPQTLAISKL
jgi:hypothetical protein